MSRKRKNTKISPKSSLKVKLQKPKAIKNPESEALKRCKIWIVNQNQEFLNPKNDKTKKKNASPTIEEDDNYDKVPTSADSLAILKTLRKEKLKKGIIYFCEWGSCKKECETDNELQKHVTSHVKEITPTNDRFYCLWDLCNFSTQCNSEIARHIYYHGYHTQLKTIGENISQLANVPRCTNDSKNRNIVPELKTDYLCKWDNCYRSFLSISVFCEHVKNHAKLNCDIEMVSKRLRKTKFEITCDWENCKLKFTIKYRLMEHLRKHTNERIVGCYHCGTTFKKNITFFDHCKRQPANNTEEYQCAQCFKFYASERLLRMHALRHVNSYKCSLCDMTCSSATNLAVHVRYRHLSDRPFECDQCQKKFVTRGDLNTHISAVHIKKVLECGEPGCNYIAKSLFNLKRHDAEAHANSKIIYACHCCDNTYRCGKSLSKHLINFHKFQLPSGHKRFFYRMNEDGFYRLQTMRIESLEVTKQILSPRPSKFYEDSCSEISESNRTDLNTSFFIES